MRLQQFAPLALGWLITLVWIDLGRAQLPQSLTFEPGAINSVVISQSKPEKAQVVIYGASAKSAPQCQAVLLTHHRRDVVWRANELIGAGAPVFAPLDERPWLDEANLFWDSWQKNRFHDYQCQSSKILFNPISTKPVNGGQQLELLGHKIDVIDTPGYTRGAVTYLLRLDNKNIAFTGDLIYGEGQLLDLYSLQDAIEPASIRGYHGYAARLASLVNSLRSLQKLELDLIIPARGPMITNPNVALEKLVERVQAIYLNYLSTSALHWYFKAERMLQCAEAVVGGPVAKLELMPYVRHQAAPEWIFENATSRMLISESGAGFLIDCGYQRVIDAVQQQIDSGIVDRLEGIFVTHYHDDHTDMVQAAKNKFNCPVYCLEEYRGILEHPDAYQMPAMTDKPIKVDHSLRDGHSLKWHEYDLTFHYFPGQTFYHGAVLAKRQSEPPVFFIGDSFAPSGIDDYCLLNRNLLGKERGYELCLEKLSQLGTPVWLKNEHITQVFQFSPADILYIQQRYRHREEMLAELFPWDDPNYGIDERWAQFATYQIKVAKNQEAKIHVNVTNYSPQQRKFAVRVRTEHTGLRIAGEATRQDQVEPREAAVEKVLESGQVGLFEFALRAGDQEGFFPISASIQSPGMDLTDWIEALVQITP